GSSGGSFERARERSPLAGCPRYVPPPPFHCSAGRRYSRTASERFEQIARELADLFQAQPTRILAGPIPVTPSRYPLDGPLDVEPTTPPQLAARFSRVQTKFHPFVGMEHLVLHPGHRHAPVLGQPLHDKRYRPGICVVRAEIPFSRVGTRVARDRFGEDQIAV